jgi:CBS-domain-containing membrane protein
VDEGAVAREDEALVVRDVIRAARGIAATVAVSWAIGILVDAIRSGHRPGVARNLTAGDEGPF